MPFIPTYINDADILLRWLRKITSLPPWAFLFKTDADSMYTNIDTGHTIKIIGEWLDNLSTRPDFPRGYLLNTVKSAMATVMRGNHFESGNMNLLQKMGTAMGTSPACMWVTCYGQHKVKTLLPKFQKQLHDKKLT